jgi:CheY-like chemotaxis protein
MSSHHASKTWARVLVVDDDPDFRESLCSFLKAQGLSVAEASNGQEGLRLAMLEHPDVIIMDIMMKERTEGLFAVQRIRRTSGLERTAVFVVSSLYSHPAGLSISPERAWMGQDEFFAKPVDMSLLLGKIREYTHMSATDADAPERK